MKRTLALSLFRQISLFRISTLHFFDLFFIAFYYCHSCCSSPVSLSDVFSCNININISVHIHINIGGISNNINRSGITQKYLPKINSLHRER